MALPPLPELVVFAALVLVLSLYGLAVAGHFPVEHRAPVFRAGSGAAILWGTIALAVVALLAMLHLAWMRLPLYAAVIGGGAMLLAAPLVLQPFPDSFVNGRRGLLILAGLAGALAVAAHALAG